MGSRGAKLAAKAAFLIAGLATTYASFAMLLDFGIVGSFFTAFLVTSVLGFVAVTAHELGHAAAALRYRQTLIAIAVAPFELRFRPLRLTLAAARASRDLGGYVIYADGDPSRRTVGLIAAAGPAASFALGAAALLAGLCLAQVPLDPALPPMPLGGGTGFGDGLLLSDAEAARSAAARSAEHAVRLWSGLSYALAVLSTGIGVTNLIPMEGTDGETILHCLIRPWGPVRS